MKVYVVVALYGCITDYNQVNELVTTNESEANAILEELTTQMEKDEFFASVWLEVWENGVKL